MKLTRVTILSGLAMVAGPCLLVVTPSAAMLGMFTQAVIYAIFALGIGVLLRQNGLVSFGHALYFGGAGYAAGVILTLDWMPAEWILFVVPLTMALLAFVVGLIIVRVPGIAFGMLTLAIGQMVYLLATRARGVTGGSDGMSVPWPNAMFGWSTNTLLKPAVLFMIAWVVMVVMTVLLQALLHTRFGAITEAVRDNEERARFIGIRTTVPRALVYALSALVSAVAGLLSVFNSGFISPESLHWSVSAITLLMVVVGGFRTLFGPVVGAVVYFLVKDVLGAWATHSMALFGAALIAVIVYSPHGLTGLIERWFKGARVVGTDHRGH